MTKKAFIGVIFVALLNFILVSNGFPWTEGTHENLSEYASENSVLSTAKGDYLRNLGFAQGLKEEIILNGKSKKVFEWLAYGANLEDKSTSLLPSYGVMRSVNHFHNPLKQSLWADAGLNDWFLGLHYVGESSLLWAQDGVKQSEHVGGDWSWQKVRKHFYTALTGKDFTDAEIAMTKAARDEYFARMFRGLGHQLHLIQDAGQPDHVRTMHSRKKETWNI